MTHTSEADLAWLSLLVRGGTGQVAFCETENGDIGLFLGGMRLPYGIGDTAAETLACAHRDFHERPDATECLCLDFEQDGEGITAYGNEKADAAALRAPEEQP